LLAMIPPSCSRLPLSAAHHSSAGFHSDTHTQHLGRYHPARGSTSVRPWLPAAPSIAACACRLPAGVRLVPVLAARARTLVQGRRAGWEAIVAEQKRRWRGLRCERCHDKHLGSRRALRRSMPTTNDQTANTPCGRCYPSNGRSSARCPRTALAGARTRRSNI
jgi:hypothetical protein